MKFSLLLAVIAPLFFAVPTASAMYCETHGEGENAWEECHAVIGEGEEDNSTEPRNVPLDTDFKDETSEQESEREQPAPPEPVQPLPVSQERWNACNNSKYGETPRDCMDIIASPTTSDADRAVAYSMLCKALYRNGQTSDAIEACSNAIKLGSDISLVYAARGYVSLQQSNYKNAIRDYTAAIQLDSKLSSQTSFESEYKLDQYYSIRAQAYVNSGNPFKALPDLNKAIQLGTANRSDKYVMAHAHRWRAKANEALLKREQAIADYRRALSFTPKSADDKKALSALEATPPSSISDSCVILQSPRPAGVGCAKGKQWFWTPVTVGANCPSSIEVEYADPESGKVESMFVPARLQTCGAGVSVVRIRQ